MPAVRQGHQLIVTFQLPSLLTAYREKAEDYISHLVGHEGHGSLLSALKAAGLASSLSAGVSESGYERNSALFVFDVTITLTEAGLHAAPGAHATSSLQLFRELMWTKTGLLFFSRDDMQAEQVIMHVDVCMVSDTSRPCGRFWLGNSGAFVWIPKDASDSGTAALGV